MSAATRYRPEGFTTLTVHMTVKGASAYIDFLKKAFSAEEVERSAVPDGRLMHAVVKIGDSVMMINDDFPEYSGKPIPEGTPPIRMNLYVPDADATWAQAVAAGCTPAFPLADQFWGDRYGMVQDPFGYQWGIGTRKENLTRAEIDERGKKMFGG